jgi:hypothetical protein
MMRDDVLVQLMESVYLLEMVEDLLSTHGTGPASDSVLRGMRITMRNVREGLTESFAWVASVEEEGAEEFSEEQLDENVPDEVEERTTGAVEALEEPAQRNNTLAISSEDRSVLPGRSILESILRPEPNPAEVMEQRRQAAPQSSLWLREGTVTTSDVNRARSEILPGGGLAATISGARGDAGFKLDAIERIVE